ncbi:EF-P lysine aminoacylase EpmA [Lichenihabitans psoromatis]|uniref:EF-P lysine aminoacylase EpmA n=1 Tax=Lichenihabitans psoromatis TaxID=2528642 RepID=UPI001035E0B5|nr:EF-P lysine aminoacylase EpmA [Lichenihabitans psoromatis]
MIEASPWWDPARFADRRPVLHARGQVTVALRQWFATTGFTEVETALLQVSPGNETHLHALSTAIHAPDGAPLPLHLHTSPEFAMKKLLAAGEDRIFTLARVFRDRERGPLHHPEFTMLEWYRAREPYERLMEDCTALLRLASSITGATRWHWRGRDADPLATPDRVSVSRAFELYAGIDIDATLRPDGADRGALAAAARQAGVQIAADDDWSDIFSRILVERIEPHLGIGRATILDRYPSVEAALARSCADDPRFAERFELYVCGVELANGFGELIDAAEQRRRFQAAMTERLRRYGSTYPIDEDFIAALAHMPPASGIALGFDRLVMLAAGATHIEQVLWTPVAGR